MYGANVHGTSPSCGGQIEAQWIWNASSPPGPVPQQVIVKQYSSASWESTTASGNCDDALKDAAVPGSQQATSSGTHYSVKPADANGNLEVYCTPTASVAQGSSGVYYMASASPVFINLGSAIKDSSGNLHILVGQQCSATLSGIPQGCTTSPLKWTATGNTVQSSSWNVASGDTSATFAGLVNPYTFTQATLQATGPSWYWDDSTTSQTVTCTATVTPPSGQGSPFPITVTQKVTLDIPTYTPGASVGTVQLDSSWGGNPGAPALHAGYGANNVPGITWKDTVTTPALYAAKGYWYHVQLISVSRYRTPMKKTTAIGEAGDSVTGALDSGPGDAGGVSYVYGSISFPADGTQPSSGNNDSPGLVLNDAYQEYNVKTESFQDFVMYQLDGTNSISAPLKALPGLGTQMLRYNLLCRRQHQPLGKHGAAPQ